MASDLVTRARVRHDIKGISKVLRLEFYDDITVDDVVAFLAFSEAERRAFADTSGDRGKPEQRPSDELKIYLVKQQELE